MHRVLHASLDVTVHATFSSRRSTSVDPELALSLLGHTMTLVIDGTSSQSLPQGLVSLVVSVTGQFVASHDGPGVVSVYSHSAVMWVMSRVLSRVKLVVVSVIVLFVSSLIVMLFSFWSDICVRVSKRLCKITEVSFKVPYLPMV